MITFAKIGNTHFNVSKDGKVVFSGGLNSFVLAKSAVKNAAMLYSLEGSVKFEILLADTAEATMNDLMQALATVMFDGYADPIIAGDAIIYDCITCYAVANNLLSLDMIAVKGSVSVETKNAFGGVSVAFRIDNGVAPFKAFLGRVDALTLWDDVAKSLTYFDYTVAP